MNISFYPRGKKPVKVIYFRMYEGRFDISRPTGLLVTLDDWNTKTEMPKDPKLKLKLTELQSFILSEYNKAFSKGHAITGGWLKEMLRSSLKRPKSQANPGASIYISDFANDWIKNRSDLWRYKGRSMTEGEISQYAKSVVFLKEFEGTNKIMLRESDKNFIQYFAEFLSEEKRYARSTVNKRVDQIRFFLNRAIEAGLDVDTGFKALFFIEKEDEYDQIFLSEKEIEMIHKHDFSDDYDLDNTADNLIISCWTSLRNEDFLRNLDTSNISEGRIRIKSKKTGTFSVIPLHPMIKDILEKRFGNLPAKFPSSDYNKNLKKLGKAMGFDSVHFGRLYNNETKRKEFGHFRKWELITGHIGRRSFVTNVRGLVPDETIAKIAGWSTTRLLKLYDKTSKTDHADKLAFAWENKYELKTK